MFNDPGSLISAFLLGFLGSAHCLGMCGGLASALGLNAHPNLITRGNGVAPTRPFTLLLGYNFGRISSYCLAGFVVGALGFWLSQQLAALTALRYLAAVMLILMGLYLGQWFNGLLFSEKLGQKLWYLIQPLGRRFIPIQNLSDAFGVGLVWGWLPCGLVYSALIWASLEANIVDSALIMLCFGLGTLPSMLATGYFAHRLSNFIRQRWFRSTSGILMVLFGIWSLPIIQSLLFQHSHS